MAAPIAWILGIGVAAVGGYFLLKDDKKKSKKSSSDRRQFELAFGRMALSVEKCGPVTDPSDEMMAAWERAIAQNDIGPFNRVFQEHCPAAFDVSDDVAITRGQLTLQTIETAIGTAVVAVEKCPELANGEQVDIFLQRFYQDLGEMGPLGAATAFRSNIVSICAAVDSVSGEELHRRGRQQMIDLGMPI